MSIEGELLRVGEEQKPSLLGRASRKGYDYLSSALPDEDLLPTFSYILGSREVYVSRQEDVWLQLHLMNYDTATIAELTDTEALDIEVSLARLDEALADIDWEDVLFEIVGESEAAPEALVAAPAFEQIEVEDTLPAETVQFESGGLDMLELLAGDQEAEAPELDIIEPERLTDIADGDELEEDAEPDADSDAKRRNISAPRANFYNDDDLDWQENALCAQTDPEAFFPEKGGTTKPAKKICEHCDVKAECLDYAIRHDERFGIWGGLSERERRKLKRRVI